MAQVVLDGVSKVYPDGTRAVSDLNLAVPDGKLMVLVGPSGCGKTTALRMVAGLEEVTRGRVIIGKRVVNDLTPKERDVAMVFQNYALYPHMTVYQNIALSLKIRGIKREEMDRRVRQVAATLEMEELLKKRPRELSGGQRQRVAMGRAIVRHPQVFLMDEPLSNLDAKLRIQMRSEISRLQRELAVTTIYVTHDQTEAMTLGHEVAVMQGGVLQQVGSPQELYRHPKNMFVGGFIGAPSMNMLEAQVVDDADGIGLRLGSTRLPIPAGVLAERPALAAYSGGTVVFGIRPEDMEDAALSGELPDAGVLNVKVEHHEDMGSELFIYFDMDVSPAMTEDTRHLAADQGVEALRALEEQAKQRKARVIARIGSRSHAHTGERASVRVDMRNAHFFDVETGDAIYGSERAIVVGEPA